MQRTSRVQDEFAFPSQSFNDTWAFRVYAHMRILSCILAAHDVHPHMHCPSAGFLQGLSSNRKVRKEGHVLVSEGLDVIAESGLEIAAVIFFRAASTSNRMRSELLPFFPFFVRGRSAAHTRFRNFSPCRSGSKRVPTNMEVR